MKSLPLLVIVALLTGFAVLTTVLLLKEPPVWPDEAVYADVAHNFIKENRLGSDLLKGTVLGAESHLHGQHPAFYYLLIFWFKLFGFSIINQRWLSVAISFGLLTVFYFLAKLFFSDKSPWWPVIAFGTFIIDATFLKASRVSRPEIFILFFASLSFYLLLKAAGKKIEEKLRNLLIIASGFLASLAFLSHLIGLFVPLGGILFFFISEKLEALKSKKFYLFIFSSLTPIVVWFLSIYPNLDVWKAQVFQAAARKRLEWPWIWLALHDQPPVLKTLYLGYIFITLIFLVFSLFRRKKTYLFLSLTLILAWLFSTYGKMGWYFVLPIPFVYLALVVLLSEASRREYRFLLIALCLLTVLPNLKLQADLMTKFKGENYSYHQFGKEILEVVPENKTVFISSIPDPFYAFKTRGENNYLYQFPAVRIPKERYFQILGNSDYIVYNGSYATLVFGDLLEKYIKENKAQIYPVGKPGQYQAAVIELKPKDQRSTF